MLIYISGSITNNPTYQEDFARAKAQLIQAGFLCINPVELNTSIDWYECMRNDIKALMDCHGVALLDGWEKSKGAKIEYQLAIDVGIPVLPIKEWLAHNDYY